MPLYVHYSLAGSPLKVSRRIRTTDSKAGREPPQMCNLRARLSRHIKLTKAGMSSKLHAVCDGQARPVVLPLSEVQLSNYQSAALMLDAFPPARVILTDRGYDSDWDRHALPTKCIVPCIPGRENRTVPLAYDINLYRQRHSIEDMFAKLKDRRRFATRYDRCAHTFTSAIVIAATTLFWINES